MVIRLSYPLSARTPLYPGIDPLIIQSARTIAGGDKANTSIITVHSHSGTHIDVPRHFCPEGDSVIDLFTTEMCYSPVLCIDIVSGASQPIRSGDFQNLSINCPNLKGLLVRTGMYNHRDNDPETYCTGHPWIHPDVPPYLRLRFPELRIFGIDTISISNPRIREEGRTCHRSFLCGKYPVLLLEDLDLSNPELTDTALELTVIPWIIDDLDGVPVMVFANRIRESRKYSTKEDCPS